MKRKLSFVCLAVLLSAAALQTASCFVSKPAATVSVKQIARGDKKVHHPVYIHSISGHSFKAL